MMRKEEMMIIMEKKKMTRSRLRPDAPAGSSCALNKNDVGAFGR